jgi:uncharacterized protein YuzE
MNERETKRAIAASLKSFADKPLVAAATAFFESLGYDDEGLLDKQDGCSQAGRQFIFRPHDERQIMRLKIDREADALYLRLDDSPVIESEEVSPGVVLDFNEQNQVVGVEMLNLSKRAPGLNLKELQFQTA